MDALTELPTSFAAGTTVEYTRAPADFPANAGWTLTLYLAGVNIATVAGVASGAQFVFTLTPAVTTTLAAGSYQWQEIASKGTERFVSATGTVKVTPDISTATAGSMQTHNERTLAVINAAIEGRLTVDMQSYVIDRRQVTKIPILELRKLRDEYEQRVMAERKGSSGFSIPVNFSFTGTQSEDLP